MYASDYLNQNDTKIPNIEAVLGISNLSKKEAKKRYQNS